MDAPPCAPVDPITVPSVVLTGAGAAQPWGPAARVVLAERLSRRRSSLQMYWGRQAGRAAGRGWQQNTLHINTHKYQEYNQFKSDRDGYETRSLYTQQPSLNTSRNPLMRTPKEPAPTLKKGLKTGGFTTIFYMFSLCQFQVSCDDDGGSGDDDNEGDDEEEEERRGGLGAGGCCGLYFIR